MTTIDRTAKRPKTLVFGLVAAAAVSALVLIGPKLVSAVRPHLYTGTILQGSNPAPPLDGLVDVDGLPVDLASFDGRLVLVFFGYANCPDVCPTTLGTAALAIDQLGEAGQEVDLLMIGVDPARDSPQDLEAYVDLFDPRFRSLSGDGAALEHVAALYGVYYQAGGDGTGADYLVDHTASLIGVDSDGNLRIVWPPDVPFSALAADLRALIS